MSDASSSTASSPLHRRSARSKKIEERDRQRLKDICGSDANLVQSFKHKPVLRQRFRRLPMSELSDLEDVTVTFPSKDLGFKAVYNFDLGCLQVIKLVPLRREIFVPNIGQLQVGLCLTTIRCVDIRFISPDIIATELTRQQRPLRIGFSTPDRLVSIMRMDEGALNPGSRNATQVYKSASSRGKRVIAGAAPSNNDPNGSQALRGSANLGDLAVALGNSDGRRQQNREAAAAVVESKTARRGVLVADEEKISDPVAVRAARSRVQLETRRKKFSHQALQETFRRSLELKDELEKLESDVAAAEKQHRGYLARNLLYLAEEEDKKITGLRQQQARLRAEMVNVEREVAAAERRNQSPFFKAFGVVGATGPGGSVPGVISAADDPGQEGDEFIRAPSGATYLLRGEKLFEYDGGGTGPDSARAAAAARARKKQAKRMTPRQQKLIKMKKRARQLRDEALHKKAMEAKTETMRKQNDRIVARRQASESIQPPPGAQPRPHPKSAPQSESMNKVETQNKELQEKVKKLQAQLRKQEEEEILQQENERRAGLQNAAVGVASVNVHVEQMRERWEKMAAELKAKVDRVAVQRKEENAALDFIALHLSSDSPIRDMMLRISAAKNAKAASLIPPATASLLRITSHVELQRVEQAIHHRRQREDEELDWERDRCEAAKAAWERADSFHRQSLDVFATGRGLAQ